MLLKKILPVFIAIMAFFSAANAQVTTSGISGFVKNKAGEALNGASIQATHQPTGTVYTATATKGGRFEIANMNPGGPYKIQASFVGYVSEAKTDVFLTLGENLRQDFLMGDKTTELTTVTVTALKTAGSKTGTETNIGRDKINNVPSVGRQLNDYVRFTPQAKITGTGGISLGGQNNRYNSFMIDGAVNNDVFGLSAQGTNGGQAGVPPISIDAIDQLTVQVSTFDAAIGNFTGGVINAVTKQGTNNLAGTVYYLFRNENLTGKRPTTVDSLRIKSTPFQNKTYGLSLGGPIIKNKLFFFVNAEIQKDERPQPFTPVPYPSGFNLVDSIAKLNNYLTSAHGYNPGDYLNNPDKVDRTNIVGRIDWSLNAKNKVTLSYRYNKAERINPNRSSNTSIAFLNGAQFFPSTTHSGSFELNSKLTNKTNNKFRVSFTDVLDDRGFIGNPFPNVVISGYGSGNPSFNVGTEQASGANKLQQTLINIYNVFKIYSGKNSFSIGADIDFNKNYNLFINRNFGEYTYRTIHEFVTAQAPVRYRRSYSLSDAGNKGGDVNTNAAATFKTVRLGFFVNDDIKVNKNFTLTLGVRADKTTFITDAPVDTFFNTVAAPIVSSFYDLEGATSGNLSQPKWQISPRIGFKYNIDDENVTVRGGVGLFAGRTPLVWPGGLYQNNGVTIGAIETAANTAVILGGNPLAFRSDINNQYTQTDFGLPAVQNKPQGDMNLIAKDFKLPQVLKVSLGADKRLANGWSLTFDATYTKNLVEIDWRNFNFAPAQTQIASGPDNRFVYSTTATSAPRLVFRPTSSVPAIRNPYSNIILIRNTTGQKGFAYNFTFGIEKKTTKGLTVGANYTYGNSMVRNEGTSSVNTSNWNFMETVSGRNFVGLSNSDFDMGHRVTAFLSKRFSYAKDHAATTISMFYNGQSGNTYSYVLGGPGSIVGDGITGNDLMFVPTRDQMDQMTFLYNSSLAGYPAVSPNATVTAQNILDQKNQFDEFLNKDKYLSKRRGQYAERNGARLPFTNILDVSVKQEFGLVLGGKRHAVTVSYDIANFANMLNNEWGRQYFLSNDQVPVFTFAGYATNVPTYRFTPLTQRVGNISDGVTSLNNSRWTSQVTVRYSFN